MIDFLQDRCSAKNTTVQRVAREIGIADTTVWRWEKKLFQPRSSSIEAILEYLDRS
jgi:transcriptional regulator with XRE-family HTH domain